MKFSRFLLSLLCSVFVYVLISVVAGRDGLWAAKQMQKQKIILSSNTAEIQKIREQLLRELDALQNDDDLLSAYAGKLGFVRDGEKIVKISGLIKNYALARETGSVKKCSEIIFIPEEFCKLSAMICGGLVFIILFLGDLKEQTKINRKRKQSFTEDGVYVLQQM